MALSLLFLQSRKTQTKIEDTLVEVPLDATIRRSHQLNSSVTTSPLEFGGVVADHVIKQPRKISIEGVVSNNPVKYLAGIMSGTPAATLLAGQARAKSAYDVLKKIYDDRIPLTITTPLESYENMIMESLDIPEDSTRANALWFTATFTEIKIVTVLTTPNVASVTDEVTKVSDQASEVVKTGTQSTQQAAAATQEKGSLLYDTFSGIGLVGG